MQAIGEIKKRQSRLTPYLDLTGLYRGLSVSLAVNLLQAPVAIGSYELLKSAQDSGSGAGPLSFVPLPYIAGVLSSLVIHPLDTLRKQAMTTGYGMVSKNAVFRPMKILKDRVLAQGVTGLYSGFLLTVARNVVWLSLIYSRQTEAYKQLEAL